MKKTSKFKKNTLLAISLVSLMLGIFFSGANITGHVISEGDINLLTIRAGLLILIGIISAWLWTKIK
jgi:hypothetical protein